MGRYPSATLQTVALLLAMAAFGIVAGTPAYPQQVPAQPSIASVENGASFVKGYVSPGSIATIKGANLSNCTEAYKYPVIPTTMCNGAVRVRISDNDAPLFFVGHELKDSAGSFDQINFHIPEQTPAGTAKLEVRNGPSSVSTSITLKDAAPGLFGIPRFGYPQTPYAKRRGGFLASQRYPDYTLVALDNPARPADLLVIWATGLGLPERPVDGVQFNRTPDVYLNGRGIEVLYAVKSPQFTGVHQVAAKLPTDVTTGISSLLLCYDSGTKCSQPTELPVAAGNAWAGGWLEDLEGRPISGVPIAVDGLDVSASAPSGAFIAPVQPGTQSTLKVRGMAANPRRYNWTENGPDKTARLTWNAGFNPLRAVDARNEPEISGTIQMTPYTVDQKVKLVYVPNMSLQRGQYSASDFWKPGGDGMDYLDFLKWMNADEANDHGCGFGKTMRSPDDSYPKLVFLDQSKAPGGFIDRIRPGLAAWKATDARPIFVETKEQPTLNSAVISFDYSRSYFGYVPNGTWPCIGPNAAGIVYMNRDYANFAENLPLLTSLTWHELGHDVFSGYCLHCVHSPSDADAMREFGDVKIGGYPSPSEREQTTAQWLRDLRNGTLTDKHGKN